jgi:hypothetical protein
MALAMQAIPSATSSGTQGEPGSIRPVKYADIVAYHWRPLQNISASGEC